MILILIKDQYQKVLQIKSQTFPGVKDFFFQIQNAPF